MVRQRVKTVELDDEDVLAVSEAADGLTLAWCYTNKFKRSARLKGKKRGKTVIAINLKTLHSGLWNVCPPDEAVQATAAYLKLPDRPRACTLLHAYNNSSRTRVGLRASRNRG
jgi:hypothetical protein